MSAEVLIYETNSSLTPFFIIKQKIVTVSSIPHFIQHYSRIWMCVLKEWILM